MCLAIPVCVTEQLSENMVKARIGESDAFVDVCTMLLEEEAQPGDYLITHAGFAMHKLQEAEAKESLKLLRQVATQDGSSCSF